MTIFSVPLDELRRRGSVKWRRFEPDVLPMFVAEMDANIAQPVADRLQRAIRESDTGYPQSDAYQEAFADYACGQWGRSTSLSSPRERVGFTSQTFPRETR